MTDSTRDTHPDPADLQRYADGEIEEARDQVLLFHVESCATCREEIERVRSVTAALSLSSKAPASLSARVQSRRAAGDRAALPVPPRRSSHRVRTFLLPASLAAAAALVLFAPRAWRDAPPIVDPAASGAKGVVSRDVVFGTVMREWRLVAVDSARVAALADPSARIEIAYDGSAAMSLADSMASYLRDNGIDPRRVTVERMLSRGAPSDGPVSITVFRRRP